MAIFDSTLKPKLIYVFAISDSKHNGCLKVGEATMLDPTAVFAIPNSKELNQSAKARIDQYTKTAGVDYQLLYTESTLFVDPVKKCYTSFNDKQVHQVLERSGVQKANFVHQGQEWFRTDLETIKNAIKAVKEGRTSLSATEITQDKNPIIFRPEQRDAIDRTIARFKVGSQMLWNAKMRFGKTLSALQVVKEWGFQRTLILTHRPAVNDGWFDDFAKIFYDTNEYDYGSKTKGNDLGTMELICSMGGAKYVYFASMQDLRGSNKVGGKFNKNDQVFSTKWDLIIVDEAHEGTQTLLGQNVMEELSKQGSKVLKLSGTPFNLLDEFSEDEVFTWDYTMEQTAKAKWDEENFGDPNPYAGLPTMNIFTYDLGRLMGKYLDEDVAFNFTEFLRVKSDGTFVHSKDIEHFLDLLTKEDKESCYPFANKEYRDNFKHTLWMVPGVKAAKAMSAMLKNHPIFGNFEIVNVAGEGDEEVDTRDALKAVRNAIKNNEYTITLSCGRLTTGISVPEWTAVLMISGSFSTAASSYMQTIFRVQTPAKIDGKTKEQCYVFDFAPDRTLKVIAETTKVQSKAGKTTESDREKLGKFLNFCPIISFDGSQMKDTITADKLFTQLKKVYVERVVRSGFEDNSLYNDELLKMDQLALEDFKQLKGIIGQTKAMPKSGDIDINDQGLTKEEYERKEKLEKKGKKNLTEDEQKELEALNKAKRNRDEARSILRGISIRMPLLIYGAELKDGIKEVTIENFTSLIDDQSWEEFMPKGVTKLVFANFRKYYDKDIFIESGKRIRALAESADKMGVEERIGRITELFSHFRNPDKETVLTPWRVVNMHLGDCLGGYNFYNEDYSEVLDEPRYIDRGEVTNNVFNPTSHILEINSKTGLYPLYVAYNVYRSKVKGSLFSIENIDDQLRLWDEVIRDNIFVICKTKMAQSITKRTLIGFRQAKTNTHAFDDLINQITNKQAELIDKINKGMLFKNFRNMKFNAILGNPPYQAQLGGASPLPIYHHFVEIAKKMNPRYLSMITPSRWFNAGSGLDDFRNQMLHDKRIRVLHDFPKALDVFSNVEIKGGIQYLLWDNEYQGDCWITTHKDGGIKVSQRPLVEEGMDSFIRDCDSISILKKVVDLKEEDFSNIISSRDPFGYDIRQEGSYKVAKHKYSLYKTPKEDVEFYYNGWRKDGIGYVSKTSVNDNVGWVDAWKVLIPKAWGVGDPTKDTLSPFVVKPHSVCTETYLVIGPFESEQIAQNVVSYIRTKFFHTMVSFKKISQNAAKGVYKFVPNQDFSKSWTDAELYAKYNLNEDEIAFIEKMIKPME